MAVRKDFGLFLVACFAPAHDLRQRAVATHADVVRVETTIANARGRNGGHEKKRDAGSTCPRPSRLRIRYLLVEEAAPPDPLLDEAAPPVPPLLLEAAPPPLGPLIAPLPEPELELDEDDLLLPAVPPGVTTVSLFCSQADNANAPNNAANNT